MARSIVAIVAAALVGAAGGFGVGLTVGSGDGPLAPGADADDVARLERDVARLTAEVERLRATRPESDPEPPALPPQNGGDGDGGVAEARRHVAGLLVSLRNSWSPLWDLVTDEEQFQGLFRGAGAGGTLDGTQAAAAAELADGMTLRFRAGRFDLDAAALSRHAPFPSGLVLEGAGMDRTAVLLDDALRVSGDVHLLTLRDLTLDTGRHPLLASPTGQPFTLRLERCRLVGFDGGDERGVLFAGRAGAIYATDCRIAAGYGALAVGRGRVLGIQGALLARFERCTVTGPLESVFNEDERAAQLWIDCRFEDMTERFRAQTDTGSGALRMEGCTFEFLAHDAGPVKPRRLSDINPAWLESDR